MGDQVRDDAHATFVHVAAMNIPILAASQRLVIAADSSKDLRAHKARALHPVGTPVAATFERFAFSPKAGHHVHLVKYESDVSLRGAARYAMGEEPGRKLHIGVEVE
jgi:hypothetical protein